MTAFVESISSPTSSGRLVNTETKAAVEEFMSRIFEELKYTNEAAIYILISMEVRQTHNQERALWCLRCTVTMKV
jgi:predicted unusual protein kinase regulating ubiquinone biosynthesis (AarF/ABC1/UbiB family)